MVFLGGARRLSDGCVGGLKKGVVEVVDSGSCLTSGLGWEICSNRESGEDDSGVGRAAVVYVLAGSLLCFACGLVNHSDTGSERLGGVIQACQGLEALRQQATGAVNLIRGGCAQVEIAAGCLCGVIAYRGYIAKYRLHCVSRKYRLQ